MTIFTCVQIPNTAIASVVSHVRGVVEFNQQTCHVSEGNGVYLSQSASVGQQYVTITIILTMCLAVITHRLAAVF
jgi:hypothetical protein